MTVNVNVIGFVSDEGTIGVFLGWITNGDTVIFAADHRPARDLAAAVQRATYPGEVVAEVEDHLILRRFGKPTDPTSTFATGPVETLDDVLDDHVATVNAAAAEEQARLNEGGWYDHDTGRYQYLGYDPERDAHSCESTVEVDVP